MRRVRELISATLARYPADPFFSDFEKTCQLNPDKRRYYKTYDDALRSLDTDSWETLKKKAITHFRDHRNGQLKQGFFNQLNEAFAYRWLANRSTNHVRVLPEDGTKKPDIEFRVGSKTEYCEVKSLGISDAEITRRSSGKSFDGSIFAILNAGFFKKLNSAYTEARKQISALGDSGVVFVVITLEDIAADYYSTYRLQIIEHCRNTGINDICMKIGLRGRRKIHLTNGST